MKKTLFITIVSTWAILAPAQFLTNSYTLTPGAGIPDANPSGLRETFDVSGLNAASANLQVSLDITGGFNGDLYAYLVAPNGNLAILLNRVGVTGSNPVGYSDAGFNITLDDTGANIHDYQSGIYSTPGGQLTGTWAPDGRAIDPLSAGSVFDTAPTTANLGTLLGSDPNGTWTLFLADLSSGGGTANLDSATLTIISVPEPSVLALTGMGLSGAMLLIRRQARVQKSKTFAE